MSYPRSVPSASEMIMSKDPLARLAERQSWLEPIEQPMQNGVRQAFQSLGPAVRNMLHGTWLNEPLHAVLTDIPVGSWTTAVVFDCLAAVGADSRLNYAADAAVTLG